MKDIFLNAIFFGGILPMIFFGVLNFLQKFTTGKISIMGWILGVALGGIIIGVIYSFLIQDSKVFKELTSKEFIIALVGGLMWGGAIIGFGIAYNTYEANASQIVPIAMANMFITVILAVIIMHEEVVLWKIITGILLIFIGSLFLTANNS